MNDTLEKQLEAAKEAAERLAPIERDRALAAQQADIEEAIRKQEELVSLHLQCQELWSQAEQLLKIVAPEARELREEIESVSARLKALVGERQRVVQRIYAAGALAQQTVRIQHRIFELEGVDRRIWGDGGLQERWSALGGTDPDLSTLPDGLPGSVGEMFRYGNGYTPHFGIGNF
jgi:DNA repair exonuclease SbcCD ATPase subunit